MPTLIPTGHDYSLLSHPLFRAQKSRLFEGQGQPVYSLPMQPKQLWEQNPQPMQILYSLPPQPMPQQQKTWMPQQPIQTMLQNQQWGQHPLRMPSPVSMQSQTSWQTYYPPYQAQPMPMPMQQVEEKTIVQSMHQNRDGNRNIISFPKSQIDQEFNKARFSKQDYDIRYNLTQNGYGANNLDFVFVQKQRVFPQILYTIQNPNNQSNYCGVPLTTPMANNFASNYVAYPTLLLQPTVVVSQEVGPYISSPVKTPATSVQYQNVNIATLPGNTPDNIKLDRMYALHELRRENLFSSPPPNH